MATWYIIAVAACAVPGIEVLGKMEAGQNRAAIVSFMIRYGNKPSGGLYLHYNYVVALQLGEKCEEKAKTQAVAGQHSRQHRSTVWPQVERFVRHPGPGPGILPGIL